MKFLDFSLKKVTLPFKRPLQIGQNKLHTKTSLYLTLYFSGGFSGTGEISLLPGLIDLTPEEAKKETLNYLTPLRGLSLNIKKDLKITRPLFNLLPTQMLSSPVLFGIEMALMSKPFQEICVPINDLIYPGGKHPKTSNPTVKVKIGRKEEEVQFLNQLGKMEGISLRLDGNRNFSVNKLLTFLKKLEPQTQKKIEYLEEPLEKISDWPEVHEKTGLSLGIDESLLEYNKNVPPGTSTFIIKPSFHGGISKTLSLFKDAKKRNIKCVVSSTFETSLGLYTLALLAKNNSKTPAGINTFNYLEEKNPFYQINQTEEGLSFKDLPPTLKEARMNNLHPF
ncbi:hypothetical protein OAK75_01260 [Bacteriovoracales bacterium]|nr:hypothetical protein [Bacteriovoracales bacterium]